MSWLGWNQVIANVTVTSRPLYMGDNVSTWRWWPGQETPHRSLPALLCSVCLIIASLQSNGVSVVSRQRASGEMSKDTGTHEKNASLHRQPYITLEAPLDTRYNTKKHVANEKLEFRRFWVNEPPIVQKTFQPPRATSLSSLASSSFCLAPISR